MGGFFVVNPIALLSDLMTQILHGLYPLCGPFGYGLAIIFLTIIVKIVLFPLTMSSTKQMAAMQKLQPKLDSLREKLKDKPQELQQEIMKLYKTEGVNPFGGCLPMLLQIPFFLALFFTLKDPQFINLLNQPGVHGAFLCMPTLAKPDPLNVHVVFIALTTYMTHKSMGVASPQQKQMTYFMPAFIALVSLPFPAGVQLYWVVSNLLTVLQQMYILRGRKV